MNDAIYLGYRRLLYTILELDIPKEVKLRKIKYSNYKLRDKRCRQCGVILDTNYRTRKRGLMCYGCYAEFNRERAKWYYLAHPERVRATVKRAEAKHPERQKTRALSHFYYPEAKACSVDGCWEIGQRHHEDYNDAKDIVWLCPYHHSQVHRLTEMC